MHTLIEIPSEINFPKLIALKKKFTLNNISFYFNNMHTLIEIPHKSRTI